MAEYIDREAANEALRECVRAYPNSFYSGIEVSRTAIRKLPAADVAPVRHGRWITRMEVSETPYYRAYTPVWKCSECELDYDPGVCKQIKYCYNCGAKMEKEVEDG